MAKSRSTVRLILLFILLFFLSPIICSAEWNKQDTILEATWLTLRLIDYGQTLDAVRQAEKYHEINPILGKHPSVGEVNTYILITTPIHIGISYLLPSKYRTYFQVISIAISTSCVMHNFSIGLKVKF